MNVSITVTAKPHTDTKMYRGWRGLHPSEPGANDVPPNMPSVIPPIDSLACPMPEHIQWMSWELMKFFFPNITPQKWHNLHGCGVAMNNQGHGYIQEKHQCGAPHPDYINGTDLDAPNLPNYDKEGRQMSGNFITGTLSSGIITCIPGVDCIDGNLSVMPSTQKIVENNWFVYAINNTATPTHFSQGYYNGVQYPIVYPFIAKRPVKFLGRYFQKWDREYLPDPCKIYS